MGKPWRDAELLEELYRERGLTQSEIAEKFGCSGRTVSKYLNRYDIQREPPEWGKKDVLEKHYIEQRMAVREIADKFDVGSSTIYHWIQKHDIERLWRDDDLLCEMYCEKGMTQEEIADELGCEQGTISYRLREMGVETNPSKDKPPYFGTSANGYEVIQSKVRGERKEFLLHRLLAVCEYGFDVVEGKVVHHKNHIKWDNRGSNIEIMSAEEHGRLHRRES
jgi:transposase